MDAMVEIRIIFFEECAEGLAALEATLPAFAANTLDQETIDAGAGAADPAVREAAEATAMILDLFAPHTAEEMWSLLGYEPSVGLATWRQADGTLLVEDTITAVVQIDGKVRATLEVSAKIGGEELERLAREDVRVHRALGEREIVRAIVRPPKVVSFSTR